MSNLHENTYPNINVELANEAFLERIGTVNYLNNKKPKRKERDEEDEANKKFLACLGPAVKKDHFDNNDMKRKKCHKEDAAEEKDASEEGVRLGEVERQYFLASLGPPVKMGEGKRNRRRSSKQRKSRKSKKGRKSTKRGKRGTRSKRGKRTKRR